MVADEKSNLTASGTLQDARVWSVDDPYLYDVYTVLTVDNEVVDVNRDHRLSQNGVQRGRWHRRRVSQRQVCLSQRASRSDPATNGPAWARVSRLDARFHRQAHPRGPWELHPLDARDAAKSRCRSLRSFRHRPSLRRPATKNGRCRPAMGTAIGSDARLDDLFPEQSQHAVLGSRQHRHFQLIKCSKWSIWKELDPHGGRIMGCRTLHGQRDDNVRNTHRGILWRDDWPGPANRPLSWRQRIVSRLQRRAPRSSAAD